MARTPTGRLLPALLLALVVAACVGILASYVVPRHHRDITDSPSGPAPAVTQGGKPGG